MFVVKSQSLRCETSKRRKEEDYCFYEFIVKLIAVVASSKARVRGPAKAWIAVSNFDRSMNIFSPSFLYFVVLCTGFS